ncbi:hypothetical protein EON65_55595 [archaeon]|nr:MAG: hypothetical protein EON65_55595 [archaeon]
MKSIFFLILFFFPLFFTQEKIARERLEKAHQNANFVRSANASSSIIKDASYFHRNALLHYEPIFIASTELIGTDRVRANHFDAAIDFFSHQEKLKKENAPM